MVGTILKQEAGHLYTTDEAMVVRKIQAVGEDIPRHNHPGYNIFFITVKGAIDVTLNGEENYDLMPGKILHFDGDNFIEGKIKEDLEAFVVLVKKAA
ncbi:MAG: cupin domain-containing protein [Tissierellia bacterium]|nr:cupin domain-containing protein [Tissierellia bacterium]